MMFQYSIYHIICILSKLISGILFSCDGCYFNMSVICSYYAACHGDLDCVWSIVMVVVTYDNNCFMGRWSPILSLDYYTRPY